MEEKLSIPTPHIKAEPGAFAKTILLPGDPKRSKYIADNFLENKKLVNNFRGLQGYTGTYKGVPVSVMASGMGIPNMAMIAYELYAGYGVENIIRCGSAGSIHQDLNLKDIVVATGCCTNSNFGDSYGLQGTISGVASFDLLKKVKEASINLKINEKIKFGQILTSDTFYTDKKDADLEWGKMSVLAVEMEAYGLYLTAAKCGKKAVAMCTVSDQLLRKEFLTAEERQLSLNEMITLSLETARLIGNK